MRAATAFALALFVPYGSAFVQLSSVGNAGGRRYGNLKLDERHRSLRIASKQQAAEAAQDLLPDSQTLSEVSFHVFMYTYGLRAWLTFTLSSTCRYKQICKLV